MDQTGSKQILTGYDDLVKQYEAAGTAFEILTHPYLSTGAFPFTVVNTFRDPGGFLRLVLKCPRGTKVELFSYGLGDNGTGANLSPTFSATDAETNISERHQTNNEDFAIEGVSLHARGVRVSYPNAGTGVLQGDPTSPGLRSAIVNGDVTITDVAATILPPEIASPLTLEDALFTALRSKVSFAPGFDRKVIDHVARFDKFPEGGANSYLRANGEPSHHNYFRLHENYTWRKSGSDRDKIFSIFLVMEDDCYFFCTQPSLYETTPTGANDIGILKTIWFEFTMYVHGRAFYIPSGNI